MKLFEYKPVDYVDVHNEIPVEWMAGQLKEKQTAFDSQVDALNKTAENNLKLNTGAFGTKMYDELQKDLQGRLTSMTDNLMTRGDVAGTSGEFSKYLRDFSLDPRVKTLNKDYDLWKLHQEELLKHPGAIDMSQYGPQIGENGTTAEQAFRNYNIVLPENSIEELEQTVNKLKPNVSSDGKTFSFYDPVLKKVMQSTDKAQIEKLSADRIKQLRDDYYTNWINNPKSMYHKIKLSNNNLDLFNTPEGKKKYDELTEYLQNYAYTEYRDLEDENPYGGGNGRPPGGGGSGDSNSEATTFIPTVASSYGKENLLGQVHGNPDENIGEKAAMDKNIKNLNNTERILLDKMYRLQGDPSKQAEYNLADQEYKAIQEKKKIDNSWQQMIEGKWYNKLNPDKVAQAELEFNTYLQEELLGDYGTPQEARKMFEDMYNNREKSYMYQTMKAKHTSPVGFSYTFDEQLEAWYKSKYEIQEKIVPGLKEVNESYKKYNAYQTTGISYVVNGTKNKEAAATLFNSLVASGRPPKDMMTDKKVGIDDLPNVLKAYQKEDGSYDYSRITYEILADDMDGLVFGVHLLDKDGKSHGYEFDLAETPNVRTYLGEMVPHEKIALEMFTQATESLKKSYRNSNGSFNVERFDGSTNKIDFNRKPIGNGQFQYFVKYNDVDGKEREKVYNSIKDVIEGETLPLQFFDKQYELAYTKLQNAIKTRDTQAYWSAIDELGVLKAEAANLGKQTPQGKQDPLGIKNKK
jgi:hypothetical protein